MTTVLYRVYVSAPSRGRGGLPLGTIGDGWRTLAVVVGRKWVRAVDPYTFDRGRCRRDHWQAWPCKEPLADAPADLLQRIVAATCARLHRDTVPAILKELTP